MIKKIKRYFSLQRRIQLEIIETLISICLYLDYDGHFSKNPHSKHVGLHYSSLKRLSAEIRSEQNDTTENN